MVLIAHVAIWGILTILVLAGVAYAVLQGAGDL